MAELADAQDLGAVTLVYFFTRRSHGKGRGNKALTKQLFQDESFDGVLRSDDCSFYDYGKDERKIDQMIYNVAA